MARQRSKQSKETATVNQSSERRTRMATTAIPQDMIAELLSKARTRGEYARELATFLESGEQGVQVNLEEGVFAGKKPQSVKIGFDNARKAKDAPEGADTVRVVNHENGIYLLRAES